MDYRGKWQSSLLINHDEYSWFCTKNYFCSNCGEKLDVDVDIEEYPKCHTALHEHSKHIQSPPLVVEQLPYKSPGTTALIAFLGGLFALPGIGHMYLGRVRRGMIILIRGLILYVLMIIPAIMAFSFQGFPSTQNMFSSETTTDIPRVWLQIISLMLVLGIAYIALFIWQILDATKLAKKFNEIVKTTHKEPW
jgi:TM2 domain-containing membrane protein YozV